jgi:hypothetical protein
MIDDSTPLPRSVALAHETLLSTLLTVQRDEVRRRRRRRAAAIGVAASLALAFVVAFVPTTATRSTPGPTVEIVEALSAAPSIEYVTRSPYPLAIDILSDDDLVQELRALGVDVVIVRVNGRVILVGR